MRLLRVANHPEHFVHDANVIEIGFAVATPEFVQFIFMNRHKFSNHRLVIHVVRGCARDIGFISDRWGASNSWEA